MRKGLIFALCVLLFVAGFIIGHRRPINGPIEPIKVKVDTLVIRDTLTVREPIFVERHILDSVPVPVVDSVRIHDTLFVYLEREQVVWRDSLSMVYASGINPQVDSVRHFVESRIVTIETSVPVRVKTKWGLGVQAGMGACKDGLTPYVGVGLSYNLLGW